MKRNKDVLLTVVIVSYKQAKYIKDAINSVLSQKVDFRYELLLADDCSKDGTLEIMREYEKKYPGIIKVLERKKNMGATKNCLDAYGYASGKYLTVLEGDDYWCDDNKLQYQVDFLNNNPDYFAVSHVQEGRDLSNKIKGYFPTSIKKDTIINDVEDFIKNEKEFSSSATLYRNFYLDESKRKEWKIIKSFDPLIGDAQSNIFFLLQGKLFVSNRPMMVYRMRNNDGDSNFNSSHSISEIQYRYMHIYIELEKYYNCRFSLFKMIKYNYTLGVAYCLCHFDFKEIKKFNELCPKTYKWKIILLFPMTSIKILYNRFIR